MAGRAPPRPGPVLCQRPCSWSRSVPIVPFLNARACPSGTSFFPCTCGSAQSQQPPRGSFVGTRAGAAPPRLLSLSRLVCVWRAVAAHRGSLPRPPRLSHPPSRVGPQRAESGSRGNFNHTPTPSSTLPIRSVHCGVPGRVACPAVGFAPRLPPPPHPAQGFGRPLGANSTVGHALRLGMPQQSPPLPPLPHRFFVTSGRPREPVGLLDHTVDASLRGNHVACVVGGPVDDAARPTSGYVFFYLLGSSLLPAISGWRGAVTQTLDGRTPRPPPAPPARNRSCKCCSGGPLPVSYTVPLFFPAQQTVREDANVAR